MNATADRRLDPETLDPEALDPDTYHAVVGPALQVCAQLAAKRHDPTLHADMPSMLALIDLVGRLADCYRDEHGDAAYQQSGLEGAPAAACVMVFQESDLNNQAIGQCLAALETAYAQLAEHDVTAPADQFVARAWAQLQDGQRKAALTHLEHAANQVVLAIEGWQEQVH